MKKRIDKKLSLSKETLRNLFDRNLGVVMGGATFQSCQFCRTDACSQGASGCTIEGTC
jgi:hypothetical protein